MNIIDWIKANLNPKTCNSEEFIYNEMDSQSGYCLPVIYQPFDPNRRGHWHDRSSLYDFLYATEGEGKRLLDFGPGDGWPSLIVAPFAGEVIGVDGSVRRVEVCTQNAQRLGIANARFVHVAPGQPLPFDNDYFDGAMAASSIEQTPDPQAALRELYRVLRLGGRLRIRYESLGAYRDGREQEADLDRLNGASCRLILYDRQIEQERERMARLDFALPVEEVAALISKDGKPVWDRITEAFLKTTLAHLRGTRLCTLTHPSGETFLRWLKEAGFREAHGTRSGADVAAELFNRASPSERPADLQGVDKRIQGAVREAVQTPIPVTRPHGFDAPITAAK